MAHDKEPLTRGTKKGGSELTDRGKTKLKGQIDRAGMIIRTSHDSFGKVKKESKKSHDQAVAMRSRAQKLLGVPSTPHKETSPGKSKSNKHDERRRGFEKLLPGDPVGKMREVEKKTRKKAMLMGIAKRANDANK